MPMLQYIYVFLWVALGAVCFFAGRKYGSPCYMLAGFFGFMALWYGLRAFGGLPVFEGVWVIVYRLVLIAFLAVTVLLWYRRRKKQLKNDERALPHAEDCRCDHCEEQNEE